MTVDQPDPVPNKARLAAAWEACRDCYRLHHGFIRRLRNIVLKISAALLVMICLMYLAIQHLLWPRLEDYKTKIEQTASKAVGQQVTIKALRAEWKGFNPGLTLEEVAIRDQDGKTLIALPRVAATLSWRSIPALGLRFKQMEITGAELDVRRDRGGNIHVAGMLFDSAKGSDSDGAQWVLKQDEIVIREARMQWRDEMRQAPRLELEDVRLVLQNEGWSHQLLLTGKPPAKLAAPIEVRADFKHPLFASDISDVSSWKGVLYTDLPNTNLAGWNPYFDYPVELKKGFGSVRAWLTLDRARIADFTAEMSLSDVAIRLDRDLEMLNLKELSGKISARSHGILTRNEGNLSFGESGHSVELKNMTLKTQEGLVLPETSISQEYQPGQYGEPSRTLFRVEQVDLETLAQFKKYVPLAKDVRKALEDLSPQGRLKDFEIEWQGSYPKVSSYRVSGEFEGLTLKPQAADVNQSNQTAGEVKAQQARIPGIPGFHNLTGRIHANQLGGNIELDTEKSILYFPGIFKEPAMAFASLQLRAEWAFKDRNRQLEVSVSKADFVHEDMEGSLKGKHIRSLNLQDKWPGYLELSGKISGCDVKKLDRYLPTQTPAGLRKWLTGGIEEGFVRDVQFRMKGNLGDFPFPAAQAKKHKGEFFVNAILENAKLNYTPGEFAKDGKSPLWPVAEKIQGRLTVNGSRMEIWAGTAQTANVALADVSAVIPDMLSGDMRVDISGHANGTLQNLLRYTTLSPVAGWIDGFTEDVRGTGNARLHLKMSLLLDRMKDSKVKGELQFENNDIKLFKDLPLLSKAKGKLEFSESGFSLHDIGVGFLGGEARISGGTQEDGKFLVKASGGLTIENVRKEYPGLPKRISGQTSYAVAVRQKTGQPDIEISSNLRGVAFDFPAPIRKIKNDSLPLKVILTDQTPAEGAMRRDQIDIELGSHIAARYQRQKSGEKDAVWQVLRGGIGVYAKPPEPASGVAMRLFIREFNVDTWKEVLGSLDGSKEEKASKTEKLEKTQQAGANMLQYFTPTSFSIGTPKLVASGLQFDRVDLHVERREDSLQVGIKSRQATGLVNLAEDAKSGQSKIMARLSALNISETLVPRASELLEASDKPSTLPNLDIVAENFEIYGKKLGHLELVAGNAPSAAGRQWNIDKLVIDNSGGSLNASGKWVARKAANHTALKYSLKLKDAGNFLERLGFKDVLRDGEGRMEGDVQWADTPFSLHKPSLSGNLSLSLKRGQFLPADPGVAKLLNVLSLQSLPRRLVLDFRDVFSKGYAFDRASATANISKGVLETHNLKMRGGSSTVLMEGSADIVKETQDLHVVVIPDIDTSTATIAALIVNPVVGVGTFLAQLFLKDPLMKAMTFEYHVTGSWAEPTVTKLARKEKNETGDASEPTDSTDNTDN
ncbi:MAG: TIGR02099 family protein [Oxalobacter sp.]|nr:MAG: TIGR02099 family protein [Oxalobacter sp.]